MRGFLAGLAAGAAAVGLAWWLASAGDAPPAAPTTAPAATPAPAASPTQQPTPPVVALRRRAAEPESPPAPADDAPFAPGEAWLRVGEGYVFGETSVRRGDAAESADLVCLDISGHVSLRCPNGGRMADVPLGAVGMPSEVARTADLITDAPDDLAPGVVLVHWESLPRSPGVVLVKSARGTAYKVLLVDEGFSDASVLRRRAHLRFAEVPARAGGGVVALPTTSSAKGAPTLADLAKIVAVANAVRGSSDARYLTDAEFKRPSSLPAELVVEDGTHLLVDEALTTSVRLVGTYTGFVAGRGIATTGKVGIHTYCSVAVIGEMAGEVDVGSYAYVHVTGNLTGKMPIHSSATVVIDGDLLGEVEVSSSTTLLLRGRLIGKLKIDCTGSKFWFQQYMGRGAAEALGNKDYSNELHLQTSDMAAGTYTDIPGWRRVIVGEDAWKLLAK
jgi:hypothetical protein